MKPFPTVHYQLLISSTFRVVQGLTRHVRYPAFMCSIGGLDRLVIRGSQRIVLKEHWSNGDCRVSASMAEQPKDRTRDSTLGDQAVDLPRQVQPRQRPPVQGPPGDGE